MGREVRGPGIETIHHWEKGVTIRGESWPPAHPAKAVTESPANDELRRGRAAGGHRSSETQTACAPHPKADRYPDPLQKTSDAAAHRTPHRAPFAVWSLPHVSTLQPGKEATANPRFHGGLRTHQVPGVGQPRPAWGPEMRRSHSETSQHCVGTPGLGWNYNSREPPRDALPISDEALPATVEAGVAAGVVVGTAPWTGREPSAATALVDGWRSVSAPFSTWWLRGSRPGGFPPDPILGLCGEGGGGGGAGCSFCVSQTCKSNGDLAEASSQKVNCP